LVTAKAVDESAAASRSRLSVSFILFPSSKNQRRSLSAFAAEDGSVVFLVTAEAVRILSWILGSLSLTRTQSLNLRVAG